MIMQIKVIFARKHKKVFLSNLFRAYFNLYFNKYFRFFNRFKSHTRFSRSFLKVKGSLSSPLGSFSPKVMVVVIPIGLSLPGPWAQGAVSITSASESTTTSTASASEETSKEEILLPLRLQTKWKTSLGATSFSDWKGEQLGSFLKIKSYLQMRLNHQLNLYTYVELKLENKRAQSHYKKQSSPFSLKEAILKYTPSHWLTLRGGSLNHDRLQSQLLMDRRAFPGLFEEIHLLKGEGYTLDLFASQSIPTSTSQKAEQQEREKTPAFLISGLAFSLPLRTRASTVGPEKLQLKFFQYEFRNLPSKVAYESGLRGNNVNQIANGERTQFRSPFAGYSLHSQLDYKIHPQWTLRGSYEHLKNNRASSRFAKGELLEGKFLWHSLNRKYRWESGYGIFYNEADSSPSIYNNKYLGHNNRQGSFWKSSLHWPDYSFHARYWNHNTLYTPTQDKEKTFFMFEFELEVRRIFI